MVTGSTISGVLRLITTVAPVNLPEKKLFAGDDAHDVLLVSTSKESPTSVSTEPRFAYIQREAVAVVLFLLTCRTVSHAVLSFTLDSESAT